MSEHKTRSDRDPALALIRTAMVEKSSPRPSSPTRPVATRRRSRTCSAARCATRRCSTSAWCWGWTTRASRRRGRAAWRPRSRWTSRARAGSSPRSTWAPIRAPPSAIGSYLTLRPAFSAPDRMVAYRPHGHRVGPRMAEPAVRGARSAGRLLRAPRTALFADFVTLLHLVSLTKGAMRMVLVSQIDQAGSMRGLMTTLNKQRATYQPVACPVVYARRLDVCGVPAGRDRAERRRLCRLRGAAARDARALRAPRRRRHRGSARAADEHPMRVLASRAGASEKAAGFPRRLSGPPARAGSLLFSAPLAAGAAAAGAAEAAAGGAPAAAPAACLASCSFLYCSTSSAWRWRICAISWPRALRVLVVDRLAGERLGKPSSGTEADRLRRRVHRQDHEASAGLHLVDDLLRRLGLGRAAGLVTERILELDRLQRLLVDLLVLGRLGPLLLAIDGGARPAGSPCRAAP